MSKCFFVYSALHIYLKNCFVRNELISTKPVYDRKLFSQQASDRDDDLSLALAHIKRNIIMRDMHS
jgi:hypothetical protein